jgi:predicted transcriptional regulator YheO
MDADQQLSTADRLIIESYENLMDVLAAYLGEAFEFVLHLLTDYDHSVIKIVNGFHSGRKEGAPITDLALSMLEKINQGRNNGEAPENYAVYFSKSKYGKPVRSTTTVILGEGQRAIGLLCINLYMDSPLSSLIQNFSFAPSVEFVTENFINDSQELIKRALERVKTDVMADGGIFASQKNKEIVIRLYYQGIFKLKNAVPIISGELGISKNTVYLHLRPLEDDSEKQL